MQYVALQKVLDTEDVLVAVGPFDSWGQAFLQSDGGQVMILLAPPEIRASDAGNY